MVRELPTTPPFMNAETKNRYAVARTPVSSILLSHFRPDPPGAKSLPHVEQWSSRKRPEGMTGSCVDQWGDAARAAATASSRVLTPRARKRRRMWFLTVSVLRWSSAAICFVERPCSRRRSTSTWRGVRCGGGAEGAVVGAFLDQPEDADHPFTVHEWHRADLYGHPRAVSRDQDAGRVGGRGGAEHLAGEQLAGAAAVLGRDDGGVLATANVAEKPLGRRIDPADDSRRVEDVTRNTDAGQSLLDVAADCQAGDHHGSVPKLAGR